MLAVAIGVLVAGLVALAASVALFAACRFERFVGVRYLERLRAPRAVRTGLGVSLAGVGGAVALFLSAHGQSRQLETVAVIATLAAALAVLTFALLRVFSVFTTVSTMGVVLGVASLVVVLAVTSGFEREFQEKVLSVNAHLIVTSYGIERDMDDAERDADRMKRKLAGTPGLVRTTKFSFSAGEVMIGRVGANLKGVDLADGAPELRRVLVAGSLDHLARPASCPGTGPGAVPGGAGRVILGAELARRLRAKPGDCVQVLVPFPGKDAAAAPSAFPFRVVGLFEMGFYEYDARLAFIPLADARRLGNARQSIFGIELRFADGYRDALDIAASEAEVQRRLGPDARVIDWRTLNHNLFMALGMQKLIIALLLVLIIVVAAFNIVASLTLIVLSKTREVAILGSMGARRGALLRIFLVAGSFVGLVGTGLGILYGLLVCSLAALYGYPLDPKVYLIARLPVEISWRELLFVAAATQLVCFLATLQPALRAARLKIVDGLRYA